MTTESSDKQQITNICTEMASGQWEKHWAKDSYMLRPSGNPLSFTQHQAMLNSEDIVIKTQELVAINSLEIFTEIAIVCMTVHQVFTYKNTPNDDISVLLVVLKKVGDNWVMINGSRSQGRSPNDPLPVFP